MPGKCRAQVRCPFGDLETEHYATPAAARAAFETQMQERLLPARLLSAHGKNLDFLFKKKLEELPPGDVRSFLLAQQAALHRQEQGRETATLQEWRLHEAAREFKQLKRHDLAEAAEWTADVVTFGDQAEFLRECLQEHEGLLEAYRAAAREAEERLAKLPGGGQEILEDPEEENKRQYFLKQVEQRRGKEQEAEEARAQGERKLQEQQEVDALLARDLVEKRFTAQAEELETGDRIFDGVNEFVFVTDDGQEHTVREELAAAEAYPGRFTLAQDKALEEVQAQGAVLARLLSDEHGHFQLPPKAGRGRLEVDRLGWPAQFPPREGFRLLGGGGEVNVYLHEPTQMVYKVPHRDSLVFGEEKSRERFTEEGKRQVVKRAVYLTESKYAEVEGALARVHQAEVPLAEDVEYLKTYFVNSRTAAGDVVPFTVQPKLDPEVHRPFEPAYGDPDLDVVLNNHFSDVHSGNISYNMKTGKIVLFDCLYVPPTKREALYEEEGLYTAEA